MSCGLFPASHRPVGRCAQDVWRRQMALRDSCLKHFGSTAAQDGIRMYDRGLVSARISTPVSSQL